MQTLISKKVNSIQEFQELAKDHIASDAYGYYTSGSDS